MFELTVILICILWISLYYIESAARKGKLEIHYGWLAYSCRPIVFFGILGLFIIFVGTDWRSPFWEMIAGLSFICVGVAIGIRSLLRRKEIEARFRHEQIEPTGTE